MSDTGTDAPLRRLPLHDRHVVLGARLAPFAGWEMPLQYESVLDEHHAVRERAGVFDVSHMGRVVLDGPNVGARLRSVTTFDVRRLVPGEAHYSLYCTAAGGIADDIFVYRLAEERWFVVQNAANAEAGFARLRTVLPEARDVTNETVMLAVQGPQAMALLAAVLGAGETLEGVGARHCLEWRWRGVDVLLARTGYTGEAALPLHGHDIDEATNPFEAGLGFAVTLDDEATFTGRAALEVLNATPPARKLACVRLLERGVPRAEMNVLGPDGDTIAALTSGTFSPTLRAGIGMAYLPAGLATAGTALQLRVRERSLPAEVVRRPFYRRPRSG